MTTSILCWCFYRRHCVGLALDVLSREQQPSSLSSRLLSHGLEVNVAVCLRLAVKVAKHVRQ